ncbi:MAG: UDP-galactopyranose mutase [Casimicrobiaceae bacterium]
MRADVLVVGLGFTGATAARVLAEAGRRVLAIDRRPHVGGNAFDVTDRHGIRIHPYGPHIFHTNSDRIFDFLSRFTGWRRYEHRVLAKVGDALVPVPINRTTINRLYGLALDEAEVAAFLARVREPRAPIATSEDVVLDRVGRDLCDKIYRGYTRKHWGLDLSELDASVAARIPVRTDDDDRYFGDRHQCMPAEGYTRMVERMLDHRSIRCELGVDFAALKPGLACEHLIYTGAIDAYFDRCFGALPYRSLEFRHEHLADVDRFQPVGVVNYPNEHEFTRITEFKHLTGQVCAGTSIMKEIPRTEGEPCYPIPRPANASLYRRYRALAAGCANVSFVGRLAQYRYYNIDQAVGAAIAAAARLGAPA